MPSGSRFALAALLALATLGAVLTPVAAGTGAHGGSVAGGPAAVGPTPVVESTARDAAAPTDRTVTSWIDDRTDTSRIAPVERAVPLGQTAPAGQGQVGSNEMFRSNTTIEIRLRSNGDARIRVTFLRANLTTEAQRDAFRDLADDHDSSRTVSRTVTALDQASSEASVTTGRDMTVRSADPFSSFVDRGGGNATGELGVSVTWTNFALVEEGRLAVDDVFETPTGTWLSRLESGQTLVITPPDGYEAVNVEGGDYRSPSWHWEGPRSFSRESHPVAVFTGSPFPWATFAGVVAVGLVAVLGIVYVVRRRDTSASPADGDRPAATEATADTGDGTDASAGSAGATPTNGAADDEVDVELLSDEERVERLLDRNGGRMKQASIVKETGWSNAKVSQLLSSMEEAGQIDKLRIGRENLISFPDEDVADVEE